MKYPLAERFKAPQGEGLYTGTQMAFVRLVGCSVGKTVCTACDTEFTAMRTELGGGLYTPEEIVQWMGTVDHLCITGGEPLDRDLRPLLLYAHEEGKTVHIETSGTVHPDWLDPRKPEGVPSANHAIGFPRDGDNLSGRLSWRWMSDVWITVSPKPGYREDMLTLADEIKVVLGGLGDGPGWPTAEQAHLWTLDGMLVYVQPRNDLMDINGDRMADALDTVARYPRLRLSLQAHKYLRTR